MDMGSLFFKELLGAMVDASLSISTSPPSKKCTSSSNSKVPLASLSMRLKNISSSATDKFKPKAYPEGRSSDWSTAKFGTQTQISVFFVSSSGASRPSRAWNSDLFSSFSSGASQPESRTGSNVPSPRVWNSLGGLETHTHTHVPADCRPTGSTLKARKTEQPHRYSRTAAPHRDQSKTVPTTHQSGTENSARQQLQGYQDGQAFIIGRNSARSISPSPFLSIGTPRALKRC